MNNYNCRYYLKRVALNGTVCYENGSPVKNAIIFLVAFFPCKHYGFPVKFHKKCCGYTTTNLNGQFGFVIYDTRCYYKIKVFDNIGTKTNDICCNIRLD